MFVIYDLIAFVLFALFFMGTWMAIRYLLPGTGSAVRVVSRGVSARVLRRPKVAEWIGKRGTSLKPYLPVFLLVGAGFVVTTFAGDAFVDLANEMQTSSPLLQSIDTAAHDWAISARNTAATHFFVLFTLIGSPVGLAIIVAIASVFAARARRFRWMAYLWVTGVGASVLNILLKAHFARARPGISDAIRDAHGFSFPSGHAMGSIVVFGALAYVATRALTGWPRQSAAIAFAVTSILSVGVSRVYIGVHWISDIAAGYSAGLLWLTACTVGYETVRRIRALRARR